MSTMTPKVVMFTVDVAPPEHPNNAPEGAHGKDEGL
jgi:hypothetical protein